MHALSGAVLVVAPPTLHRQGLLLTLQQAWPNLDVVLTADGCQAPALLRRRPHLLVIVDGLLPDPPLSRLLAQLLAAGTAQPLLLLTGNRLPPGLRHYLRTAVPPIALLPYYATPEALLPLVAQLLQVSWPGSLLGPAGPSRLRRALPPTPFSRRELEVLRLVVGDNCNQQIAEALCLSVRTVESHRRALLQKTGARTLLGLAVQAVRQGWIAA